MANGRVNNGVGQEDNTQLPLGQSAPQQDVLRPPALSKRARHEYCFYFDLLPESTHLMGSLVRYVLAYGARYSAFLDVSVTHIITDKPKMVVECSALVIKWGTKVLSLSDFLTKILESYNRASANVLPISPTIQRAATETHRKRDLSHLLAEERKIGPSRTARAITPLYNAAAAVGNAGGKITANLTAALKKGARGATVPAAATTTTTAAKEDKKAYHVFQHPYVMVDDINLGYAPIYKEYIPTAANQPSYPTIHYDTLDYYCPWVAPDRQPHQMPAITHPPPADYHRKHGPRAVPAKHRRRSAEATAARLHRFNAPPIAKEEPLAIGQAPTPTLKFTGPLKVPLDRPRPGYCECCYEKYSNLEKHLQEERHRRFARDNRPYKCVDAVIEALVRPLLKKTSAITSEDVMPSPAKENPQPSPIKSAIFSLSGIAAGGGDPLRPNLATNAARNSSGARSGPLKNITNQVLGTTSADLKSVFQKASVPPMEIIEVGSDSPIYSSPSFKRRRSQRIASARGSVGLPASKLIL